MNFFIKIKQKTMSHKKVSDLENYCSPNENETGLGRRAP